MLETALCQFSERQDLERHGGHAAQRIPDLCSCLALRWNCSAAADSLTDNCCRSLKGARSSVVRAKESMFRDQLLQWKSQYPHAGLGMHLQSLASRSNVCTRRRIDASP